MLELSQNAVSDQLQIGHASHPGRSGKNNEDYYGVFSVATTGGECVVAAVADGIGGSVGGERASRLAIKAMHTSLGDRLYLATSLSQRLDRAIFLANREIYEQSQNEPALAGMGTTIVAVALDGDRLYVAHAGDSRAYLVRDGRAHQLTLDHSWAQEAIEAGRIKPEEAKTHPNRHVIRRYLGINEDVETDPLVVDPAQMGGRPGHSTTVVSPILTQAGDAIMLCSDGLTDDVNDEEIARIVGKHAPEDAARRLVDAANAAGGADNITVVILRRGGGKLPAAAGRSRMVAYGLALAGLLLVGALGWLLAGGALFGRPDGNVTALDSTPSAASVVLATSTTEPLLDGQGATVAATSTAVPTATDATQEEIPTATSSATETPASPTSTAQPAMDLQPTAEITVTETADAAPSLTSTSTPVTKPSGANPSEAAATGTGTATMTASSATEEMPVATPAPPVQPPETVSAAATAPTSTPAQRATTPTVTSTPTIVVRNTSVPAQSTGNRPTPTLAPPTSASVAQIQPPPVPPTPAPAAEGGPTSVTITTPLDNSKYSSTSQVTFAWTTTEPLRDGQCFELVFWPPGQQWSNGKPVEGASSKTSVVFTPSNAEKYGDYRWAILLVNCSPAEYQRIKPLSSEFSITFEGSPGSSSSSSGGEPENPTGRPGGN